MGVLVLIPETEVAVGLPNPRLKIRVVDRTRFSESDNRLLEPAQVFSIFA